MKRNNLFLLAYIIFIFICTGVRCFGDYPLWNHIVAAVTTSSWILAFADLYGFNSKQLNIIANEQCEYADDALLEIELIKALICRKLKQLENVPNEEVPNKTDTTKNYSEAQEIILDLEKEFNVLNSDVSKCKSEAKTYEYISTVCYVIGYLALFCIIVFEPLTNLLVSSQEIITVLSFGIILITQLLDEFYRERLERIVEKRHNFIKALDGLRKSYETDLIHNND